MGIEMKKIRKKIEGAAVLWMIAVLILTGWPLGGSLPVSGATAGSMGITLYDTILIGKDGKEYWVKGRSENIIYDEAGRASRTEPFTSELRIRNFEVKEPSGNKVMGYCIEWGVPYEKGINYSAVSVSTDRYYNLLPARVREGIKLAALYGYHPGRSVPVPGCNGADWYMATQVIIWEYQQLLRETPTKIFSRSGMPADYFSRSISGRPAEACYKYMLERMKNHDVTTSFAGTKVHLMKYNEATGDYRVTLTDLHKIPFPPKFVSEDISLSRSGNQYTFIAKKPIDITTIRFQHDIPAAPGPNLIWGSLQNGQVLMTGIQNDFTYTACFRTETNGNFLLKKISDDGIIRGVEFEISGVNLPEPLILSTDEDGLLSVDLIPGTYTVRELPSERYLPTQPQTLLIEEGKQVSVTYENIRIKGDVEITKTDVSNGKPIPDCGIEILNSEKQTIFEGRTDKSGAVIFFDLPKGKYFFREFDAPNGYLIDETLFAFSVREHGEVVKCSMTNERIPEPTKPDIAKPGSKSPKTGDDMRSPLWAGLMLGGLTLAAFTFLSAKR